MSWFSFKIHHHSHVHSTVFSAYFCRRKFLLSLFYSLSVRWSPAFTAILDDSYYTAIQLFFAHWEIVLFPTWLRFRRPLFAFQMCLRILKYVPGIFKFSYLLYILAFVVPILVISYCWHIFCRFNFCFFFRPCLYIFLIRLCRLPCTFSFFVSFWCHIAYAVSLVWKNNRHDVSEWME